MVSELTRKTKVTVQGKLSSRQQAFYRAIKNKIFFTELFDVTSEKKMLNLMNIVIQLRKVCNHPELFERNEEAHISILEILQIPFSLIRLVSWKTCLTLVVEPCCIRVCWLSKVHYSEAGQKLSRESIQKLFKIFFPENVFSSSFQKECGLDSNSRKGSLMERLLFSVMRSDRQYLDEILDLLIERDDDNHYAHIGELDSLDSNLVEMVHAASV